MIKAIAWESQKSTESIKNREIKIIESVEVIRRTTLAVLEQDLQIAKNNLSNALDNLSKLKQRIVELENEISEVKTILKI